MIEGVEFMCECNISNLKWSKLAKSEKIRVSFKKILSIEKLLSNFPNCYLYCPANNSPNLSPEGFLITFLEMLPNRLLI